MTTLIKYCNIYAYLILFGKELLMKKFTLALVMIALAVSVIAPLAYGSNGSVAFRPYG